MYSFAQNLPLIINETELNTVQPQIQIIDHTIQRALTNENWKTIIGTGPEAQVILMSISSETNKKNELGLEKLSCDTVIFIVEGKAIAEIDNNRQVVQPGDMILIPKNTEHNLINLDKTNP